MRKLWEEHFLNLAQEVASMGTCIRRQVGCILVDVHRRISATGFNGPPPGWPHCNEGYPCPGATAASGQSLDLCYSNHSEINALTQCKDPWQLESAHTTCSPCISCVKALLCTSIRRVIFIEKYPHKESELLWTADGKRSWIWFHDVQRFMGKVKVEGDCWIWQGKKNPDGYGIFTVGRKFVAAHRYSFYVFTHPPGPLQVRHSCDTPSCVNPRHLLEGTAIDNAQDCVARGRKGQLGTTKPSAAGTRNHNSKFSQENVAQIKALLPTKNNCQIAKQFGVTPAVIWKIRNGETYKD